MSDPTAGAEVPWYRRRGWLIGAAAVVVLAITVVTDLPQHASRPAQISSDTSTMNAINAGVRSCAFAVSESLGLYQKERTHALKAGNLAVAPGLLRDDQNACSFTSEAIFTLSNLELPGSVAGKYLQRLVGTVTTWATSDGLAAVEAIETLWNTPRDQRALRSLSSAERHLADDRIIAVTDVQAADRALRATLPAIALPRVVPSPG